MVSSIGTAIMALSSALPPSTRGKTVRRQKQGRYPTVMKARNQGDQTHLHLSTLESLTQDSKPRVNLTREGSHDAYGDIEPAAMPLWRYIGCRVCLVLEIKEDRLDRSSFLICLVWIQTSRGEYTFRFNDIPHPHEMNGHACPS